MSKAINFLITLTVFVLAVQFYVLKPETTLAQTNGGVSNELFGQGNKENENEIEREELNLDNNKPNREEINREEFNRDEELDRTESLEEHKPKKPRIRDVKAPNYGQGNIPYQPPKNEVEVEF